MIGNWGLIEFFGDRSKQPFTLADIYYGKIEKKITIFSFILLLYLDLVYYFISF